MATESVDAIARENDALLRRCLAEVYNGHDLDHLPRFFADDFVSHWLGDEVFTDLPAWKAGAAALFAAFPDASFAVDDLFCAGDRCVWRGTWRATQRGDWGGVAASNRTAAWSSVIAGRFAGGKLAEEWVAFDRLGLFRQLGAIPLDS